MTVDQMIDDIIRREGGYVNHPADRGGPTKYGITLDTLRKWRRLGPITAADVRDLTEAEAREIYRRNYYLNPGIDLVPSALQPFLFDCAVNHGPRRAVQFLQEALHGLWYTTLRVDGILGPTTCEAVTRALAMHGEEEVLERLIARRRNFYLAIVDRDPSQKVFLKGWLNRLAEFERAEQSDLATQLAVAQARIAELSGQLEQAADQIGSQHLRLQQAVARNEELEAEVIKLERLLYD